MADFSALIAQIEAYVKQNGNNEITGNGLQEILVGMVNALGTVAITALQGDLADEVTARTNADGAINAKIPAEASSSNKLADKAFVTGLTTPLQNAVNAINANIENGYVYAGIATPSGTPVSGRVCYLALQAGTYTNFGGLTLTEGVNILKYNGTTWSQEQLISIADIYKNPLMGYYECDTAGATAAKTVAATGYVLPATGGSVKIKMANRNTVANATMNINSTGAKPLYYNGQRAGVGNTWDTNEIVEVFYDGTNYQAYNVAGSNGDGVFDISAYNLTDGQPTPYVDLAAALGTDGANVPQSLRKGGMSVKFIQGSVQSIDNKYVQFRLMSDSFNTTPANWQGVDDVPTAGSDNLVKSGGVIGDEFDVDFVGADTTLLSKMFKIKANSVIGILPEKWDGDIPGLLDNQDILLISYVDKNGNKIEDYLKVYKSIWDSWTPQNIYPDATVSEYMMISVRAKDGVSLKFSFRKRHGIQAYFTGNADYTIKEADGGIYLQSSGDLAIRGCKDATESLQSIAQNAEMLYDSNGLFIENQYCLCFDVKTASFKYYKRGEVLADAILLSALNNVAIENNIVKTTINRFESRGTYYYNLYTPTKPNIDIVSGNIDFGTAAYLHTNGTATVNLASKSGMVDGNGHVICPFKTGTNTKSSVIFLFIDTKNWVFVPLGQDKAGFKYSEMLLLGTVLCTYTNDGLYEPYSFVGAEFPFEYTIGEMPSNRVDNLEKANEFSALLKDTEGEVESFMFFSDPHPFQFYNSPTFFGCRDTQLSRMKKYFDEAPVDFVLCGGDWLTNHKQSTAVKALGKIDGVMNKMFPNAYYPVFGNHDNNYQGELDETEDRDANDGTIANQTMVNLLFRKYGEMYYSFMGNNTRFYVFNSGIDWVVDMDPYKWNQLDWFARRLLANTDEHIVLVTHIADLDYQHPEEFGTHITPVIDIALQVAQAFNARGIIDLNGTTFDFSSVTGKIACILCGHLHFDATAVAHDIPLYCIKDAQNGDFDMILIDYNANKLKSVRVGTGSNREIDLA